MKRTILILSFVLAGTASAQTLMPQEGPTLNRKVRNLGMGNIGVAIYGTADSSPFYNPAGLNDVEKGRFQFFTNTVEAATSSVGMINDFRDLMDRVDASTTDAEKTREFNKFLQENTGEYQHIRYTLDIFNYARKNFAVGLLFDERMDLSFRDQSFPHFEVRNLGDVAGYVSGSTEFFDRMIQVGVTLRPTVRFSMDEADQQITLADILGKDANGDSVLTEKAKKIKERRFALGVDLGLKSNLGFEGFKKTKVYETLKPEVGVTWQDIGDPQFGPAPDNKQSISAGMAIHPALWKLKNTVGLEFRDINQERPFLTKVHFGLESQLPWILSLRGGLSQGYPTAGLSADFWIMKVDTAVYFEEIGIVTREKGNLRLAATVSFNI